MRVPSVLKAPEKTLSSCPRRTVNSLPLAASHTRAVVSSEAVTMRVPSGLNTADLT